MQVPRKNKLRELLREGKPTLGTHIISTSPGIMEVIGLSGMMDYVEYTSVYGPYDLYALENMCMAAELHDIGAMIKVDPEPKNYLAQRAVGAGFQSVLFADMRSVQEVEDAIRAVRPDPQGTNGCWMHRVEGYLLECGSAKMEQYFKDIVLAVMIEKKPLYDRLEDVLNLDGVDMIQFGPCDLSCSMGMWGQSSHPKIQEAEERTIKLALKYDKHPRVEIDSVEGFEKNLEKYVGMGVRDFCVGTEVVILYEWMKKYGDMTRKALEQV